MQDESAKLQGIIDHINQNNKHDKRVAKHIMQSPEVNPNTVRISRGAKYIDESPEVQPTATDIIEVDEKKQIDPIIRSRKKEAEFKAREIVRENVSCVLDYLEGLDFDESVRIPTKFQSLTRPIMSIRDYLIRLMKYSRASDEVFITVIYHILLIHDENLLEINILTIHRMLLAAVLVVTKYHDDDHYNNKYFAHIGGVTLKELNALELEFLDITNFHQPNAAEYADFYSRLRSSPHHKMCTHESLPELEDPEILKCEVACMQLSLNA